MGRSRGEAAECIKVKHLLWWWRQDVLWEPQGAVKTFSGIPLGLFSQYFQYVGKKLGFVGEADAHISKAFAWSKDEHWGASRAGAGSLPGHWRARSTGVPPASAKGPLGWPWVRGVTQIPPNSQHVFPGVSGSPSAPGGDGDPGFGAGAAPGRSGSPQGRCWGRGGAAALGWKHGKWGARSAHCFSSAMGRGLRRQNSHPGLFTGFDCISGINGKYFIVPFVSI